MKNRNLIIAAIICFTISVQNFKMNASSFTSINYASENAINFVESGITFSVFQNGEFDFYLNSFNNGLAVNYNSPNVSISFNSGHNYDAYVQYDQFGAVIQIENTPVFYDNYGRIAQVGNININYHSGRLTRIGSLQLHYNSYGHFAYHSGFINQYNRSYAYHPYHNWFIRPYATFSIVRSAPYRHHYSPHRYHYYNDHRYGYKPKRHHKGHYVAKRNMYNKRYSKGTNHKKNYVSRDFRRKEYTTQRSHSSSNRMNAYGRKSKNGLYNRSNVSNGKNMRSNGYNARSKTTVQRAPAKRTTNVKRNPNSQSLSKTRQNSRSVDTNKNNRSRQNTVQRAPAKRTTNVKRNPSSQSLSKTRQNSRSFNTNKNSRSRQTVSNSSPKRTVRSSATNRNTGKQSVHRRPSTVHHKTVKQRKTVKNSTKARRTRP